MRVAAVVELVWDPASIEVDPVSGAIDWSRAAAEPSPGSMEAVQLAVDAGDASVFGLGPAPGVHDLLRECLAMGAVAAAAAPDVHALAAALAPSMFELLLVPHRSGDGGPGRVAGTLAGLLGLPQATGVEAVVVLPGQARVMRRLDRGEREELAVPLPAVIAVEPGIVRPRGVSPAALLAARSVPLTALSPAAGAPRPIFLGCRPPRPAPPRMPGPPGELDAEARIAAVVGGSAGEARQRELATGTAAEVAERIIEVLRAGGYLQQEVRGDLAVSPDLG